MDYDVAEDNSPYMVMEYLEGIALSDYLKTQHKAGKTLPTEVVAGLIQDLADALDYAHQRGIIHRDIKPANVMLRAESSAIEEDEPLPDDVQSVLTDFGVARMQNVTAARTATGALIGTPTYMSPEQVQGTTVDARSDVYALGVMLYEMLAGKTPFDPGTDTPATILFKQVLEEPPPLENVDSEVQDVIDKALAKDPDERFQQAGELAAAFKEALGMEVAEGARIQSRDALSEMPTHFSITTQPMKIPGVGERQFTFRLPFALTPGRLAAISGAAGALVLIVVLALLGVFGGRPVEEEAEPEEAESEVVSVEPTAEPTPTEEPEQEVTQISADNAHDVQQIAQFTGGSGVSGISKGMRISPDGTQIAVFGTDGVIRIFDVESRREVIALEGGHGGPGRGLAFSPDGSVLASGGEDFKLSVWDIESGQQLLSPETATIPDDMDFSPDGEMLVYVGSRSSSGIVLDSNWDEVARITGHSVVLGSVDISSDGELVASGNVSGNVVVTEFGSWATVTTLNDGADVLHGIQFSEDVTRLAAGSLTGDIYVWDTATWELERTWNAHSGGVEYLAWTLDGSVLLSAGFEGRVVLWDPNNGAELHAFQQDDGAAWMLDLAPDGSYFATLGGIDGVVRIYGLK
jgi:hypothetical protein